MQTEADFQAALDADPGNGWLRQTFADWLDEQGDPRADGYRAVGRLKVVMRVYWLGHSRHFDYVLPSEAWAQAYLRRLRPVAFPSGRRAHDDAAALAWSDLTDADRADVLAREG